MTKFEYISVPIPVSIIDTMQTLKDYGDIGWKMVTMYNGFIKNITIKLLRE